MVLETSVPGCVLGIHLGRGGKSQDVSQSDFLQSFFRETREGEDEKGKEARRNQRKNPEFSVRGGFNWGLKRGKGRYHPLPPRKLCLGFTQRREKEAGEEGLEGQR